MAYTPEVYIFGNAHVFMTALEGLQAIFDPTAGVTAWAGGNGPFPVGVLIKIALIIGLLFQAGKMMHTQQAEVKHIFVALFLYIVLFVPTSSVILYNVYNGDTYKVDHVPIGVGYAGGFVSTMSYDLMNTLSQVDNLYTGNVNPLSLSKAGFAGPLKNLLAIQRLPVVFKDTDPNLWYTMVSFAQSCNAGYSGFSMQNDVDNTQGSDTVESLITGAGQYSASSSAYIFNSKNPWNTGGRSKALVSCAKAAAYLNNKLHNFFGNLTAARNDPVTSTTDVRAILGSISDDHEYDYQKSGITTTVENNISHLFPSCSGVIGTQMTCTAATVGLNFMENELEACAAKEGVYGATSSRAQMDMEIGALPAFCTTMSGAMAHQEVTFAGMASSFLAFVGPMMTVLQFLFFALAPIVAVIFAFLGPAGPSYIGKYLMFGAWTQSFLPVAAIINNLAQYDAVSQLQHMLQSMLPAGAGTTNPYYLGQFSNMGSVFTYASRSLSMADMIMAFTPLVTAFVFTGSYFALTQLGNAIVNKEGLAKNQDTATPNMGATTFNSPVAGYAQQSSGNGVIATSNAGVANAGTLNAASMTSSAATYANQQGIQQTAAANSSFGVAMSAAASQNATNGITNAHTLQAIASMKHAEQFSSSTVSALTHSGAFSQEQAEQDVREGVVSGGFGALEAKIQSAIKHSRTSSQKAALQKILSNVQQHGKQASDAADYAVSYAESHQHASSDLDSFAQNFSNSRAQTDAASKSFSQAQSLQRTAAAQDSVGLGVGLTAEGALNKLNATSPGATISERDQAAAQTAGSVLSRLTSMDPDAVALAKRQMGGGNLSSTADKVGVIYHSINNMAAQKGGAIMAADAASFALRKFGFSTSAAPDAQGTEQAVGADVAQGAKFGMGVDRTAGLPNQSLPQTFATPTASDGRGFASAAQQNVGYNPNQVASVNNQNKRMIGASALAQSEEAAAAAEIKQPSLTPLHNQNGFGGWLADEAAANPGLTILSGAAVTGGLGLGTFAARRMGHNGIGDMAWKKTFGRPSTGPELNPDAVHTSSIRGYTPGKYRLPKSSSAGSPSAGEPSISESSTGLSNQGEYLTRMGGGSAKPPVTRTTSNALSGLTDSAEELGDLLEKGSVSLDAFGKAVPFVGVGIALTEVALHPSQAGKIAVGSVIPTTSLGGAGEDYMNAAQWKKYLNANKV